MTTQNEVTIQNTTKVELVIMIMLLLALMPVSLIAQGQGRLLYKSIFTSTGLCWQDNGTVMKTSCGSVFFAEIYENCLIETSGIPSHKYRYTFIGYNKQNCRIYRKAIGQNSCNYYIVDQNYDLTRVYERDDFRFPDCDIKMYSYYEIVKGDCLPKRTPREIMDEYGRIVESMGWIGI